MQNKKMTILNALNMIAITFYVVAIPGYYFFDYRIMNGVFGSCAAFLFLSLLQFIFYGRSRLLITDLLYYPRRDTSYETNAQHDDQPLEEREERRALHAARRYRERCAAERRALCVKIDS